MKIAWTINVHPTVNVTENLIGPFGTGSKKVLATQSSHL